MSDAPSSSRGAFAPTLGPIRPIVCRVVRRDHPSDAPRTEVFAIRISGDATLHELLAAIADDPTPQRGARVTPPAWDAPCLEGSCGGCGLRANGRAALACTTTIDEVAGKKGVVVLEPLGVFPVVRDLIVDLRQRDRDVDATARVRLAIADAVPPAAPTLGAGLGGCLACGLCLDACPEVTRDGGFVGAQAILRNRRAHDDPSASARDRDALDASLMRPGGISECGHAQNCLEVCPTAQPLAEALADASRVATSRFFFPWRHR